VAKEWYLIGNQLPIYNSGYESDEWQNYAQDGFQETLFTTMLGDDVEFINSDFSVIVPGKAVIQSVTEDSADKAEDRQILAPIGTLSHFSYVRFKDVIWLIDAEPSDNKFYEKAPLKLCNNQLKWQDSKTKQIFEYWYYGEDVSHYASGIYESNVVISYSNQMTLHLPKDTNTEKLHDGMRFMIDKSGDLPYVYKLTKYDGITGNNKTVKILKITLTQSVYDKDVDNAELMIADYYEKKPLDYTESTDNYTCRMEFESDEIALSSSEEYKVVFFDNDGKEIFKKVAWKIVDKDFKLEDSVVIQPDESKVKVSVKNDKKLIGKSFILNAMIQDKSVASIEIKIVPLW